MGELFYGYLGEGGYTVRLSDEEVGYIESVMSAHKVDPHTIIMFVLYAIYFLYAVRVDLKSIFCVYTMATGQEFARAHAAGPAKPWPTKATSSA